jgi:hypothetical protein
VLGEGVSLRALARKARHYRCNLKLLCFENRKIDDLISGDPVIRGDDAYLVSCRAQSAGVRRLRQKP